MVCLLSSHQEPDEVQRVSEMADRFFKGDLLMGKTKKSAVLAALAGTFVAFGGCLGINPQQFLYDAAIYAAQEFLLDNNGIFDLFQDGGAAAG